MKWTHRLTSDPDAVKVEYEYGDILDPIVCAEYGVDPIKETRDCIEIEYLFKLARKHKKVILDEEDIQYWVDSSEGALKEEWKEVQRILLSGNPIVEVD